MVRLARRELVWIDVTAHPTAEWIAQQITEAFPWNDAPRYLIRDLDEIYGALADFITSIAESDFRYTQRHEEKCSDEKRDRRVKLRRSSFAWIAVKDSTQLARSSLSR